MKIPPTKDYYIHTMSYNDTVTVVYTASVYTIGKLTTTLSYPHWLHPVQWSQWFYS